MASRNTSHRDNGFSLIEVVIVIALFGFLLAIGLLMGMEVFRGTTFRSGRDTLVSALVTARGRALANSYQSAHGVCYDAPNFVIFRGSYAGGAASNEVVPGNPALTVASDDDFLCSEGGIVFEQLSASTDGGSITLSGEGHGDETVAVNEEGAILW